MPGIPGDMNGYADYDRGGPVRGGYSNGLDPYSRDEIYRDERREDDDPYRRPVRNGRGPSDRFNADHLADQNSLSDFNSSEPAFELDHLATFAAGGARKGTMHVEDGLRKLRQMENTTGIWTMRCILLVERRFIVILDKNSGEELERFPVQCVQEPTAIFKNDRREIYNNLILFTVMDESNKKDAQADMHIFQSTRTPAQVIVDEMVAAKKGHPRVSSGGVKDIYAAIHKTKVVTKVNSSGAVGQATETQNLNRRTADFQSESHFVSTSKLTGDERQGFTQNIASNQGVASNQNNVQLGGGINQNAEAHTRNIQSEEYQTRINLMRKQQVNAQTHNRRSEGYLPRNESTLSENNEPADINVYDRAYIARRNTQIPGLPNSQLPPPNFARVNEQGEDDLTVRSQANAMYDDSQAFSVGEIQESTTVQQGYKIPPPPSGPAPEPPGSRDPYDFQGFRETIDQRREYNYNQFGSSQYGASQFGGGAGGFIGGPQRSSMMARPSYLPYREREDFEGGSNELLERDVQLLNHCFDDIEKFVARLQQAAEAYKELERRKRERGGGKGKKNAAGDGMLGHRARPPPAQDFIDIFQKFKLAFNLLAKLKAHIHDPNAPELVHFLFTPLSLIYEASRDPIHGSVNLAEQAVAPVLTLDAKQLLLNCLTSKEIELWQALGKNWTTSKDEWKGYIPPYVPRFYDGWQPAPTAAEEVVVRPQLESAVLAQQEQIRSRAREDQARAYAAERVMPFPPEEERFRRMDEFEMSYDRNPRAPTPPQNAMGNPAVAGYREYVEQHIDRNMRAQDPYRRPEPTRESPAPPAQGMGRMDDNTAYLHELKRTGALIYEVLHDRQGKNQKELTVQKGDYLQVLDSNRNWWKVRNYKGETGYCPYTILKEVSSGSADNGRDVMSSVVDQASIISGPPMAAPKQSGVRRDYDREERRSGRRGDGFDSMNTAPGGPSSPHYGGGWGPGSGRDRGYEDDIHIPPLSLEDEENEMHAFRPIEPATHQSKGVVGVRKTQPQDELHNELKSKMGGRRGQDYESPDSPRDYPSRDYPSRDYPSRDYPSRDVMPRRDPPPRERRQATSPGSSGGATPRYLDPSSGSEEVVAWLQAKGFSTLCRRTFQGYTGAELFSLHRQDLEQLIGREEAARLEGQLILQKKMTGYKTQSTAQLQAIFQKRRARAESQDESLGQPPSFRPSTPSDGSDSDSNSDDRQLADTGKTLRDLLIRQRQKIIGAKIFDQQQ